MKQKYYQGERIEMLKYIPENIKRTLEFGCGTGDYDIIAIDGLRPSHSTRFKIVNALLFNRLWDAKYHQFAVVAKPTNTI